MAPADFSQHGHRASSPARGAGPAAAGARPPVRFRRSVPTLGLDPCAGSRSPSVPLPPGTHRSMKPRRDWRTRAGAESYAPCAVLKYDKTELTRCLFRERKNPVPLHTERTV